MARDLVTFTVVAVTVGSLALSSLSLVAIAGHAGLAANALAVMALETRMPKHPKSTGTVLAAVEGEEEPARFEGSSLDLGNGGTLKIIRDRATRCVSHVVQQDGKVVGVSTACFPEPGECEDESLEDTGLRIVRQ